MGYSKPLGMQHLSPYKVLFCVVIFAVCHPLFLHAQDTVQTTPKRPNLFLDCHGCYRFHDTKIYLKEKVTVVNFVRNKDVAQIHLLITREQTGNGTEWTLKFIGSDQFMGLNNTVTFFPLKLIPTSKNVKNLFER